MRQAEHEEDQEIVHVRRGLYKLLLGRFKQLSGARSVPRSNRTTVYCDLVRGFEACSLRDELAAAKRNSRAQEVFSSALSGFQAACQKWRQQEALVADDFNILEVVGVAHKECHHSLVLKWLLDHDLRRFGTHAQERLGFKLFLDAVGLPARYAETPYWVRREVVGHESRMDIEIGARGVFVIHIENKIWAAEGDDQTPREWADLVRRAKAMGISVTIPGCGAAHAIFLTPEGRRARSPAFIPLSWATVAAIFDAFAERAIPPSVKLFSAHYAQSLRASIVRKVPKEEPEEQTDG